MGKIVCPYLYQVSLVTLVTSFAHHASYMDSVEIGGSGGHGWNQQAFRGRMEDILNAHGPVSNFGELRRVISHGLGDDRNSIRSWRQESQRIPTFSYQYQVIGGQLFLADGRSFHETFITRVRELGPQRGVVVDEAELTRLELLEKSMVNEGQTVYTAAGDRGNYRYIQKWEKTEEGRVRMTSFDIASVVGQDLTQTQVGDVIRAAIGAPEKKSLDRDGLLYATMATTPHLEDFFEKATRFVTSPREVETQANVFSNRSLSSPPDIHRQKDESPLHVNASRTPSEERNQHMNETTRREVSEPEPVIAERTALHTPALSTHRLKEAQIKKVAPITTGNSTESKKYVRPNPRVLPIARDNYVPVVYHKNNVLREKSRRRANFLGFHRAKSASKDSQGFKRKETTGSPKSLVKDRIKDVAIQFERRKQIVIQLRDVLKSLPRRIERRVAAKVSKWQQQLTQFTAKMLAAGIDKMMSFGTKHRPFEVENRGYRGLEKIGNYVKKRTMILRQWFNVRKKRGISLLPSPKEANPTIPKKTIVKPHKERPFLIQVSELDKRMKQQIRQFSVLTKLVRARLSHKEKKVNSSTPMSLSREGVPTPSVYKSVKQRRESRLTRLFTKIMSIRLRDAINLLAYVGKRMKETTPRFRKPVVKQAGKWQWAHKSEPNRYKINIPTTDRNSLVKVIQKIRLHVLNRYRVLLRLLSLRSEENLQSVLLTIQRVSTDSHKEDGNFIFKVYTSVDSFLLSLYLHWLKSDSQLKAERPPGFAFGQPRVHPQVKRRPFGIIYLRLIGQHSGSVVVA